MSRRLTPTAVAAAVGSVDTALFLARRPGLFREAPGRAAGTVAALGLWAALAATAVSAGETASRARLGLAATLAAGNTAILAMHLRHHVAGPRVFLGAAASGLALADTLRRR